MYYIYILRCRGGELYTGIAADPKRRFREHLSGGSKGAKYTKSHPPVKAEMIIETESKSAASSLEYRIKKLTKAQKEQIVKTKTPSVVFSDGEFADIFNVCAEETLSEINEVFSERTEKTEGDNYGKENSRNT